MTMRKTNLNRRGSLDATLRGMSVAALLATGACMSERPAREAAPIDDSDGSVSDSRPVTPDRPLGFTGDRATPELDEINTWFVELESDPLALGGEATALDADLQRFRSAALAHGVNLTERRTFRGILNGVTVRMSSEELPKLATMGGVRAVYPVGITQRPNLTAIDPMLDSSLAMTGADFVQEELGFDGTGIKVGVIDTGIDLQHPDLADRIEGGFDFVGDAYDANDPNAVPVPEPGAGSRPGGDDCGGHGTHVAGIIGAGGDSASGGAHGVAPGVTFRAYRVFGCEGSTNDDTIAAAIELAFQDGMDVINLSLGSDNGFGNDFLSVALSRVLELGMIPVASAGNNGRSGIFTVGSPAAGANVITVASFDNLYTRVKRLALSDGTEGGYSNLTGAPAAPEDGSSSGPLVYVGQGCNADTYTADPAGKVALITRGACPFAEKYTRAVTAGAIGVVIENNAPGNFSGTLGTATATVFGIGISQETGAKIRALLTAGTEVTLKWIGGVILSPNPTGDQISAFSSYGLTPELALKPDIGAPGGYIRSAWPLDRNDGESPGYAVLSGTSMSSPYIAGAVALLLEALPDTPVDQVRTILQNNAEPKAWFGAPTAGYLDSVHHQGAGMLRIDRAVQATTQVTPSKLALGESVNGPFTTVLYIRNRSNEAVTYTLGNDVRALATGPDVYVPAFSTGEATATFSLVTGNTQTPPITEITVPARGIRSVTVVITAPVDLEDQSVYGGYLTITPAQGSKGTPVTVPYAGFKGDFQSVEVLSRPVSLLAYDADSSTNVEAPEGTAYTMVGQDKPGFAVGLRYGVQTLKAELVPLDGDAWIKPQTVLNVEMMRRSNPGTSTPFTLAEFDATSLPNGRYRVRVTMLKAGGDVTNPAHTVTAESPYFQIARP